MAALFSGIPLARKDGSWVHVSALQGKTIGIYFSAHWCPPCRNFTPILRDFYDQVADDYDFEIVFVSSDHSEFDLLNYMAQAHGNWLYIPFGHNAIPTLKYRCGISGIPTLVILKPDGSLVTKDGCSDVTSLQPRKAIQKWRY